MQDSKLHDLKQKVKKTFFSLSKCRSDIIEMWYHIDFSTSKSANIFPRIVGNYFVIYV